MADLVVASANCHNNRAAIEAIPGLVADVVCVYEVHRRGRELVGLPGYTYLTGSMPGPSREVGILVSKRVKRLRLRGYLNQFISAAATRFKSVGKERWGHVALVKVADTRVAVIALHPVAGPDVLSGFDPNHLLVRRYASAMRWLERTVADHIGRGCEVVVASDIQMFETWDRPWSPHAIFREHDMAWFWDRIDVAAWTPGLTAVTARARADFPSDHPALRVALNLNHNRRK